MASEITEENDEDIIDKKIQKENIRKIIEHQKSLYLSSSSSSSSSSSCSASSPSSSSSSSRSLFDKMRGGGTSLRRLFDMEHTSLGNYFQDYSGSPVIKPIYLWGSDIDSDGQIYDPWGSMKRIISLSNDDHDLGSNLNRRFQNRENRSSGSKKVDIRKLKRKKSFRRLPGFGLWRFRGFRLRKKLRILLCGRKFLC